MRNIPALCLLPLIVASVFASDFQDAGRQLRFSLPDGYQPIEAKQPEVLAAWIKRGKDANDIWFLSLSQMKSSIRKGEMPKSEIPAGWSNQMIDWRGERINCLRFIEKTPQATYVDLQIIFPASPNALRLTFGALDSSEAELRSIMTTVVGSVQVPIGYRQSDRSRGIIQIMGGLAGLLAVVVIIWWVRKAGEKK
jgi:hypothetical protein